MESVQQATAVLVALALLGTALYWLRAKGVVRFASSGARGADQKQLQSLERLPLTAQHSLHLVRVAERLVLIAVSPGGCSVLDRGETDLAKRDL